MRKYYTICFVEQILSSNSKQQITLSGSLNHTTSNAKTQTLTLILSVHEALSQSVLGLVCLVSNRNDSPNNKLSCFFS